MPDHTGVAELLGLVAAGRLLAFEHTAAEAHLAPDLRRRVAFAGMAAAELAGLRKVENRLAAMGTTVADAMGPYLPPLAAYHDRTVPADWWEALTKAYVGDAASADFVRLAIDRLGFADRRPLAEPGRRPRREEFARTELRAATAADPVLAHRLSMWARRLAGEGLAQAQAVAQARPALTALLLDGGLAQLGELTRTLTRAHYDRMAAVGLQT
ncbi:MAG TPA: ferritin-like fold-containing protein [Pilimelia sp.]|nr:ferritin-like fold-containing protein [Pilimelia sp.]